LTQGPRIIERASKASSVRVWTWGHSSPAWIARRRTPVTVPRLTASLGIVGDVAVYVAFPVSPSNRSHSKRATRPRRPGWDIGGSGQAGEAGLV
jgi:hypothetical protein